MFTLLIGVAVYAGAAAASAGATPAPPGAATTASPPAAPASPVAWTFAFYCNYDNDLLACWPQFAKAFLARMPANPQVHIVAMVDRPGHTGTTLYELGGGKVTKVAAFPEKDFGRGTTFKWFIRQIHARYPSTHLGIGVIDHGYGWRYFSWDNQSQDDITMPEMQSAIAGAGVPIDVLSFDACNMADVAVLYQAALAQAGSPPVSLVKYVVASEEEIEMDGFPYDVDLTPLANDASLTPQEVAVDMVNGYARYYRARHCFGYVSLGAIDVAKVGAAKADLQAWVARLRLDLPVFKARYDADLAACIYAWDSWQVDLPAICDKLAADPLIADPTLKALSATVADDCRGAMLSLWSGSYSSRFNGMTLWWGTGDEWRYYRQDFQRQVAFGAPVAKDGVGWYAFLKAYNAPAGWKAAPRTLQRDKYSLADVTFSDARHGWAVGNNDVSGTALILRTADGGAHWKTFSGPAWGAYGLAGIGALDAKHVWAVGSECWPDQWADSLVLKSSNGGVTWPMQTSHTYQFLASVDFTSPRNGWVSGTNGALLHSTDGGAHWVRAHTWSGSGSDDLWSVDFTDARHGWVAGGNAATMTGFIRRTTDGGKTWTLQQSIAGHVLYGLKAPDCAVGGDSASGSGIAYYSADGGATWAVANGVPTDRCLFGVTSSPGGAPLWLVGTQGLVMTSTDGGAHWSACGSTPVARDLTAASFTSATHGWVVGDCKELLHTTDGGATWSTTVADVTGPRTKALNKVVVRMGHVATIRYEILDDMSATAHVTVKISGDGRTRALRLGRQTTGAAHSFAFRCTLLPGSYTYRVLAIDESGNRSTPRPLGSNTLIVK